MPRTIKHFSLDRIDGTELRVVADTDGGVLRIIEVEEEVVRALLAHEHAHPLAECPTTRASRTLKLELSAGNLHAILGDRADDILRVLNSVGKKLCLDSPREVFANDLAISSGFGDALLHINKRNVANAAAGMTWRKQVQRALEGEVAEKRLTEAAANLLMLVGDVQGYLELAIEIAPFYRAGKAEGGREIESILQEEVLPKLRPGVSAAYFALRERYEALEMEMSASALVQWGNGVCSVVGDLLASEGAQIEHRLYD